MNKYKVSIVKSILWEVEIISENKDHAEEIASRFSEDELIKNNATCEVTDLFIGAELIKL